MVLTVTLNPAVDKTISVNDFEINTVNRLDYKQKDAGGKGINVSKVLKELSIESIATGFLGGESGHFIKKYLKKININNEFIEIDEPTRENIKIVDNKNKLFTDINDPGPLIKEKNLNKLKVRIDKLTKINQIVVFAGSVPKGVNDGIYNELIKIAKTNDCFVILDTYGKPFEKAIKSKANMIKPNIDELNQYLNLNLKSNKEIKKAVKKEFIEKGIKSVVVSLGKEGAVYIDKNNSYHVNALNVDVKSTVGAGDAMVAGITYGLYKSKSIKDVLKYGAACSTANIMTSGSQTGNIKVINKLLDKFKVNKI
ncbi:MAG: 1-phosphofructokinase [Bacillota bacterium]